MLRTFSPCSPTRVCYRLLKDFECNPHRLISEIRLLLCGKILINVKLYFGERRIFFSDLDTILKLLVISRCYEDNTRQCPTFPWPFSQSIIGPRGLNGRVRYGNGCGPSGMATGNNGLNGLMDQRQLNGQASRPISAGELNPLQDLHLRSINPVVYGGPSGCLAAPGFLILGRVSRLDAFSGYPFRT